MNTLKFVLAFLLAIPLAIGGVLNLSAKENPIEKCAVIGKKEKTPDGEVISINQSALKKAIEMPLSVLAEDLQIVALENSDDALIGQVGTVITENYILAWGKDQNPFKLFDKKGKFICTIGSHGQGPNEYINVYEAQIDEKNNRIGLLPWNATSILCYDLQGNPLEPVRLPTRVPKGKIKFSPDGKSVAVVALPFPHIPFVAWTQDLEGKVIHKIPKGDLALPQDFSNEVFSTGNTGDFDINLMCIMPTPRPDSLYHFDTEKGKLVPQFTFNFSEDPIPWHIYSELPGYFYGNVSYPVKRDEYTTVSSEPKHYIVCKKSLKGAYAVFKNDYWGNIDMWPSFSNGYYTQNFEPANLVEHLENVLKSKDLSKAVRDKLSKLKDSISDNDNNYIIYAKLKE